MQISQEHETYLEAVARRSQKIRTMRVILEP